ncbi:MAG: RDD family protein [Acidimicrobiales bacterium]
MSDGWHDDPLGRYPKRYYDGSQWTHHVTDGSGQTLQDPLGTQPTPGGAPPTAPSVSASEMSAAGGAGYAGSQSSPWLRLLARIVDSLVLMVPVMLLMNALGMDTGFEVTFEEGPNGEVGDLDFPVASFVLLFAVAAVYEILMVGRFGRTLGKMALGLSVTRRADAGAPGYGVATVRYAATLLYAIPLLGIVLVIMTIVRIFTKPLQQTIHDSIASTVVAKSSSL